MSNCIALALVCYCQYHFNHDTIVARDIQAAQTPEVSLSTVFVSSQSENAKSQAHNIE